MYETKNFTTFLNLFSSYSISCLYLFVSPVLNNYETISSLLFQDSLDDHLTNETRRLEDLRSPTRSQSTEEEDNGGPASESEDKISTVADLNFTFNLEDSTNKDTDENDHDGNEEDKDDSFETISQMELAGVSSFYAIRTKGSPKRSPKKSPRGGEPPSPGESTQAREDRLLRGITPRRPIREPLEVSTLGSSSS